MENGIESIAKEAYQAYGSVTDFKNFRGEPMPDFNNLPEKIIKAWIKATTVMYLKGMSHMNDIIMQEIQDIKQSDRGVENGR